MAKMCWAHVILIVCMAWLMYLSIHGPWWYPLATAVAAEGIYICSGIIFDHFKSKRIGGGLSA